MKLKGKAALINATSGVEFPHYADVELDLDTTSSYVFGRRGEDTILSDRHHCSGHLGWEQVDVALLAALLGSQSNSGTIKRVRLEEHTISEDWKAETDARWHSIALKEHTNIVLTEIIKDAQGNRLERVDSDPAAGQYSIKGYIITLPGSMVPGDKIYVDYFFTQKAG